MPLAVFAGADVGGVRSESDRRGRGGRLGRGGVDQLLAELERGGAQGLGVDAGLDRQKLLEHTGGDPVRHQRRKLRPDLVEFRSRAAMRWPADTGLRPVAAGTAEARQPNRDRAEQGRNPVGPVVLQLAHRTAGPAGRPMDRMAAALRRNDRLLDPRQKLLAIRVRQTQIRQIAEIPGTLDLQHIDAVRRTVGPALYQAQDPPHP
jgi:hypothetical protein